MILFSLFALFNSYHDGSRWLYHGFLIYTILNDVYVYIHIIYMIHLEVSITRNFPYPNA